MSKLAISKHVLTCFFYVSCQNKIKQQINPQSKVGVSQTKLNKIPNKINKAPPEVARCGVCGSMVNYSPTLLSDCIIRCTNDACLSYICTLEKCYKSSDKRYNVIRHQQNFHRKNADPNICYFCKAVKDRTGTAEIGQCANCGMHWCLFKNCTFETTTFSQLMSHRSQAHHKDGQLQVKCIHRSPNVLLAVKSNKSTFMLLTMTT